MSTLTSNTPRLPEHCPHKLATSCRLTASPACCACQDRRPHTASYSKYIDGVGFVPWGTRQYRYCWFCKEFWNARIEAANIRQSDSRIPEVPDQSEFLECWFDWHRGYKIVKLEDGSEEHHDMIGERLENAAPGHLPRTLNELRENLLQNQSSTTSVPAHTEERVNTTIDALNTSELDYLEIDPEDRIFDPPSPPPNPNVDRPGDAEYQTRRVASLRRELRRMRTGIERVMSGLQELGETVPDSHDAVRRSASLDNRLQVLQNRLGSSRRTTDNSTPSAASNTMASNPGWLGYRPPPLSMNPDNLQSRLIAARAREDQAREDRRVAHLSLQHCEARETEARRNRQACEHEIRIHEQNIRVFGSREDVERQGSEYESPIGNMFNRAYDRYRVAEEHRQRGLLRITLPNRTNESRSGNASANNNREEGVPQSSQGNQGTEETAVAYPPPLLPNSTIDTRLGSNQVPNERENHRPETNQLPRGEIRGHHRHATTFLHGSPSREARRQARVLPEDGAWPPPQFSTLQSRRPPNSPGDIPFPPHAGSNREQIEEYILSTRERMRGIAAEDRRYVSSHPESYDFNSDEATYDLLEGLRSYRTSAPTKSLDKEDGRPEPKADEELNVKLECKICFTQLATVAVLPCGHFVMCKWCAEQTMPSHKADKTTPVGVANCPMCRKQVKQKVTIYSC